MIYPTSLKKLVGYIFLFFTAHRRRPTVVGPQYTETKFIPQNNPVFPISFGISANYLFLFFDSFVSALIFPIRGEMAVYAMIIFKKYNPHLIFIITVAASISGSLITWLVGNKLQFLKQSTALKHKAAEIKNAENKWNKYVVWLLIFSPLKILGNPMSLLAGFLNTDFKKFFLIIFASKFCYYFWLIYFSLSV